VISLKKFEIRNTKQAVLFGGCWQVFKGFYKSFGRVPQPPDFQQGDLACYPSLKQSSRLALFKKNLEEWRAAAELAIG
jgi:hypothetical protein